MSDTSELGVLYTEYSGLTATTPVASLWSYETRSRGRERRRIALSADGSHEYWLDRSDPLLNTILPGTGVSLIVNFGDPWAAGRSLASSRLLPRVCVVGPVTQARILRVGKSVHAVGAVLPATLTPDVFGIPASQLVDRIAPLQDLWTRMDVERLFASLTCLEIRQSLSALKDELIARVGRPSSREPVGQTAPRLIKFYGGRVSIDDMARSHGLSRQQFAHRFWAAAGLPPKLFARITRFQKLVHVLLSTDVSKWASVSPGVGFYDQAHMINEFRAFAGSPPTVFFRPHGGSTDPAMIQLRGRPCEWLRLPESLAANETARLCGGDQKELASSVAGVCSKT
jgi:AraC-like DNA-binding protein